MATKVDIAGLIEAGHLDLESLMEDAWVTEETIGGIEIQVATKFGITAYSALHTESQEGSEPSLKRADAVRFAKEYAA